MDTGRIRSIVIDTRVYTKLVEELKSLRSVLETLIEALDRGQYVELVPSQMSELASKLGVNREKIEKAFAYARRQSYSERKGFRFIPRSQLHSYGRSERVAEVLKQFNRFDRVDREIAAYSIGMASRSKPLKVISTDEKLCDELENKLRVLGLEGAITIPLRGYQ